MRRTDCSSASGSRSFSASDPEDKVLESLAFWLGRLSSAVIEVRSLRETCYCLSRENEEMRALVDNLKQANELLHNRLKARRK